MEFLAFIGFMTIFVLAITLVIGGVKTCCEVWESSSKINQLVKDVRELKKDAR